MKRKIGVGRTMPKGQARPLGTPRPKPGKSAIKRAFDVIRGRKGEAPDEGSPSSEATQINFVGAEENALQAATDEVESTQSPITAHERTEMTLTFKGLNKRGNRAIYAGAKNPVGFALANFPDKQAPATIEISGLAAAAAPKVKMTAEERKAARANAPKPTLAEKAARAKKRADDLAAQLAADQSGM